jgi:proline iminopeptidase
MNSDQYTIEEKMLDVGYGHQLYLQLWGNKDAKEFIVFLHGGPGSGVSDSYKGSFDPLKQKVIFFDQRGCGKSIPYGSLDENTTADLVEDINKITEYFGAKTFILTGSSWGSCLALAYAIDNPDRVTKMVMRGIFTGRKSEIDFVEKGGYRSFFPDVWDQFVESVPESNRADPAAFHKKQMLGSDKEKAKRSAYAYARMESSIVSLDDRTNITDYELFDPLPVIIESHYIANGCFLNEGYIIKNAKKLKMPVYLIQGRYDAVCPPFAAYDLASKLPNCHLYWTIAGHSGRDRANFDLTKALLSI